MSLTQVMVLPDDERARVIGERVYRGGDRKLRKCVPEEVITMQECRDKLIPSLPPANAS